MAGIPHTKRRGAIYYFRRTRRFPNGNQISVMVSLRTSCPRAARYRVSVLNARFEGICMRLFCPITRPLGIDSSTAKRVFDKELALALAALEDERE